VLTVQLREQIFAELPHLDEESRQLIYEYALSASKIKIVVDRTDFFFMQLPQGKPDPSAYTTSATMVEDERPRVKQSKNKHENCGFYALRMITFHVGKNSSEDLRTLREKERLGSLARKKISGLNESLHPEVATMLTPRSRGREVGRALTKTGLSLLLSSRMKPTDPTLVPHYKDFLLNKNFENFYDFCLSHFVSSRMKIKEEFLKSAGYAPKAMFEAFPERVSQMALGIHFNLDYKRFYWEGLPALLKNGFIEAFAHRALAEISGLERSTWTPESGIDSLITHLKAKGPIVVCGKLGTIAYSTPATKMKRSPIQGFDVYHWSKDARLIEPQTHSITITGAFRDKKESYVFFVDPNDGSDPHNPSIQKVYIQTYLSLRNHIFAIDTFWPPVCIEFPGIHYGWVMKSANQVTHAVASSS
jgi:hypothetical protein